MKINVLSKQAKGMIVVCYKNKTEKKFEKPSVYII